MAAAVAASSRCVLRKWDASRLLGDRTGAGTNASPGMRRALEGIRTFVASKSCYDILPEGVKDDEPGGAGGRGKKEGAT
jgi:hypothetical protein